MDRAERLAQTTLALVNVPSESRDEAAAAEWVERDVPRGRLALAWRDAETLWYATVRRTGVPLVVFAGHLDTVPAQGNVPGRIADGWVEGLGASDMKGGVAVMVELARWLAEDAPELGVDVALLFFPREELPQEESALPTFFAACADVHEAELVVLLEPTDNEIHAGCLGNLNAELVFRGESAHSARPWTGVNAIERAVEGLARVLPVPAREAELSGLTFVEVASATLIEGGVATNVVPPEARCTLNFRYAPDRRPEEAEAQVRAWAETAGAELVLAGNSAPAPVVAETPLARRLRAAGPFPVRPKQAWTPVAEFATVGLDALNLGPGATRYAHRADERVEIAELVRTFDALRRFVAGS